MFQSIKEMGRIGLRVKGELVIGGLDIYVSNLAHNLSSHLPHLNLVFFTFSSYNIHSSLFIVHILLGRAQRVCLFCGRATLHAKKVGICKVFMEKSGKIGHEFSKLATI